MTCVLARLRASHMSLLRCTHRHSLHFISFMSLPYVSPNRCQLYYVERTDMQSENWDRVNLTYPPSDFMTAVARAADYQRRFDPLRPRYDWRVTMAS